MAANCEVFESYTDVKNQLLALDLDANWLLEVIRHIGLSINAQTEDHPSWGVGITVASEGVFALRSILKPHGWTKEEEKGFALVVHPNNRFAINLAKGDSGTGDPNQNVLTVSEKGICTENAISKNQMTFDFPEPEIVRTVSRPTWYLIYSRGSTGICAELSLPSGMSDAKQIASWRKRIILPVTPEDGEFGSVSAGFDDGGYEIKLSRKN
jgi:hypothetical protein